MEKIDKDTEMLAAEVDDSEEAVVLDTDDDDDVARLGNGYIRRVYPVSTPKLCGNDFAAVKDSDKFSSLADASIDSDPFSQKHHEYSSVKDVVGSFPSQCYKHMSIGDNKTKVTQGLSQVSTRNIVDEDNICEKSESQETEDLSQANALGFVDHYISTNSMHFLENDTPGKTSRLISPLVSSAKGSQKLAKRANIGTSVGLSKNFEWDDEVDDIEKNVLQNKDMKAKSNGSKPRYVKDPCNKKLMRESTCNEFSNLLVENYKAFDEVGQVSKMNIGENVPDSYDVGFDTQMAAEAMEALIYAPSSNFSGNLAHQNAGLTGESKPLRRRRDMKKVRVLFSQNMDATIIQKQKKILEKLGSLVTSSCSEATHFVADRFVRTKNMLEAIALGKPVVTHMWIVSCGQAKCFVGEKNYLLRDVKKEREFGFSMPVSLASARKAPLLKGRKVFVTPNINPGKELIVSLVKAVNGEVLFEAVDKFHGADRNEMIDDLLILSCEQDYALCAPFLEKGASIYSSEFILNGIVIQKLEFERHQLFENQFQNESSP